MQQTGAVVKIVKISSELMIFCLSDCFNGSFNSTGMSLEFYCYRFLPPPRRLFLPVYLCFSFC